jgi:hypothetical protein
MGRASGRGGAGPMGGVSGAHARIGAASGGRAVSRPGSGGRRCGELSGPGWGRRGRAAGLERKGEVAAGREGC